MLCAKAQPNEFINYVIHLKREFRDEQVLVHLLLKGQSQLTMHLKYALSLKEITAKPSRRLINHALKDDNAMQATFIGQARAREALDFGLGINAKGYNLYVMGEQATGRFTLVHEYIAKYVQKVLTPDDWCYINNFEDEREPFALRLPPGKVSNW